jgi:hypothetical protein
MATAVGHPVLGREGPASCPLESRTSRWPGGHGVSATAGGTERRKIPVYLRELPLAPEIPSMSPPAPASPLLAGPFRHVLHRPKNSRKRSRMFAEGPRKSLPLTWPVFLSKQTMIITALSFFHSAVSGCSASKNAPGPPPRTDASPRMARTSVNSIPALILEKPRRLILSESA